MKFKQFLKLVIYSVVSLFHSFSEILLQQEVFWHQIPQFSGAEQNPRKVNENDLNTNSLLTVQNDLLMSNIMSLT